MGKSRGIGAFSRLRDAKKGKRKRKTGTTVTVPSTGTKHVLRTGPGLRLFRTQYSGVKNPRKRIVTK